MKAFKDIGRLLTPVHINGEGAGTTWHNPVMEPALCSFRPSGTKHGQEAGTAAQCSEDKTVGWHNEVVTPVLCSILPQAFFAGGPENPKCLKEMTPEFEKNA